MHVSIPYTKYTFKKPEEPPDEPGYLFYRQATTKQIADHFRERKREQVKAWSLERRRKHYCILSAVLVAVALVFLEWLLEGNEHVSQDVRTVLLCAGVLIFAAAMFLGLSDAYTVSSYQSYFDAELRHHLRIKQCADAADSHKDFVQRYKDGTLRYWVKKRLKKA
jgi:hypothetical protein